MRSAKRWRFRPKPRCFRASLQRSGTVIANKQVVELPLERSELHRVDLPHPRRSAAGRARQFQVSGGSRVSVSGARAEDNNYTLDGVNNNETFFKAFAVQPSIDAIQEFKIQTNITSAEFGQAAGANINVVTKSGTNDIHGVLFEFLRNNVFDAPRCFCAHEADVPPEPIWRPSGRTSHQEQDLLVFQL